MNINDKTARCVNFKELHDWIRANVHLTWYFGKGGGFDRGLDKENSDIKHSPLVKYIYPNFDTRTMSIFHIEVEGMYHIEVDFREEFDGTILDLLSHKLKEPEKYIFDPENTAVMKFARASLDKIKEENKWIQK